MSTECGVFVLSLQDGVELRLGLLIIVKTWVNVCDKADCLLMSPILFWSRDALLYNSCSHIRWIGLEECFELLLGFHWSGYNQ